MSTLDILSALIPKDGVKVFLLANDKKHGFAFKLDNFVVYVLLDTMYHAYKPRRGISLQDHAKVYLMAPKTKKTSLVSNWVDIHYQIPLNAHYMPIGYEYKTSTRYKQRHVTIIPFPLLRGFAGAVERKSGGTQEVRMTFSIPAKLRMQFGKRLFTFETAFFLINTIDKIKVSDSYSRGSAIGFTTDLLNSKDKPTHWGTVINGESRIIKTKK